jgi:hypothetical protein
MTSAGAINSVSANPYRVGDVPRARITPSMGVLTTRTCKQHCLLYDPPSMKSSAADNVAASQMVWSMPGTSMRLAAKCCLANPPL